MSANGNLEFLNSLGLSPFRPRRPWWGGDLQTLRNKVFPLVTTLRGHSERQILDLGDGTSDKIWALLDVPETASETPLIVLIHGLTGSENSDYMRSSSAFFLKQNYRVLRINLRGAGPSNGTSNGHYHSGCAGDIQSALNALDKDLLSQGVFMIGYSLGGNILTHLLARQDTRFEIKGAVTVSASIDPAGAANRLMATRNTIYQKWLLKHMKRECLAGKHDLAVDRQVQLSEVRSVYEFDDVFTAPLNGYRDADDYYAQTSGCRVIPEITVPTLLIHALDDPWIPQEPYEDLARQKLQHARILLTKSGGHVGFHSRDCKDRWYDMVAGTFFGNL